MNYLKSTSLLKTSVLRKTCLLFLCCCAASLSIMAQKTVTGTVSDEKGETLVGVRVVVSGTPAGTTTDANGRYSIVVPSNESVLQCSYVGFLTATESVRNKTVVDFLLKEDAINLNEVVVVGYGTQKKINLTGAVSVVSGEEVTKRNAVSLSNALQGTTAGLTIQQLSGEPGADGATIRLRGIGSITSSTRPYILVDGVQMDIDKVDPNTIETITTLKDAASTAIYGIEAANGVILITTKRGKEGPVKISYKGTISSQSATNTPDPVSTVDFMKYTNLAYANLGTNQPYSTDLIAEYEQFRADNWNRFETNWKDEILKDQAMTTNHSVSISGGSSTFSFLGTANYVYQDGLIDNNNFSRFNLRLNMDAHLTKWMKFSLDGNIVESTRTTPSTNSPKSIINKSLYFPGVLTGINADGTWGVGKNADNPIASARVGGTTVIKTPDMMLNSTITISPVAGLDIVGQYGRQSVTTRGKSFVGQWEYFDRGTSMGMAPIGGVDGLTESWRERIQNYYRFQATFGKSIKDHTFSILGGFDAKDISETDFRVSRAGFVIPGYEYLDNGSGTSTPSGGGYEYATSSFYTRLTYNYKEKYLFEFNTRIDASSRFVEDLRWHAFPSVSLGWVFTNESFMQSINKTLSLGKLRVSYGELGNQNLNSYYPAWAVVNTGSYGYFFDKQPSTGVAIADMSNPNISWETSRQINAGLDLGFWNNKLSFTGDFYIKYVEDMLMKFPPPYFQGLNAAYRNASSMKNTGWEVALHYRSKLDKVKYGVSFILDDVKNEITDLNGLTFQDKSNVVGYPHNGIWGYQTDGYFQTMDEVLDAPYFNTKIPQKGYVKYVNQNDDNVIDSNDQIYLGDPFPHYNFGVRLNAEWNGFDALVFIQGVGKRAVSISGIGLVPFSNGSTIFSHQTDTWSETNPNAAYPILLPEANAGDNFQRSDKWVREGAYARLKTVEFGYTVPKSFCKKLSIQDVRLFLSGQNLLTVSDFYKGYDPEVQYGGSNGGEFYPIMRTITFGIDIKF